MSKTTSFLTRPGIPPLAYLRSTFEPSNLASPVGLVYVGGFMSSKEADKATAVEKYLNTSSKWRPNTYLRFDYTDLGESVNELPKRYSFLQWHKDVIDVIDQLTEGPQILLGSSMGSWLSLLAAIERPDRIVGIMTISASIGFLSRFEEQIPEQLRTQYSAGETINLGSPLGRPFVVNKQMVTEAATLDPFSKESIPVTCPVRCLHSINITMKLVGKLASEDVEVTLRKTGSHRMQTEYDFTLIMRTLEALAEHVNTRKNKL